MLNQRKRQEQTGRIIPQTNEEYGYEDHYPLWSRGLGSESADTLRRTAWDIVMAGGYQTAGESARRGTNIWPDTGGGWMNGRGDDTMTMFSATRTWSTSLRASNGGRPHRMTSWWTKGKYCLAQPGEIYAIYLPNSGGVTVQPRGWSLQGNLVQRFYW